MPGRTLGFPPEAWKGLAERLIARRCELDPRWENRTAFASATGVNYRLIQDLESCLRDTVTEPSLAKIDRAYQWPPGTCLDILRGLEPDRLLDYLRSAGLAADVEAEVELLYRRGDPDVREAARLLQEVSATELLSDDAVRMARGRIAELLHDRAEQVRRARAQWRLEMDNIRQSMHSRRDG